MKQMCSKFFAKVVDKEDKFNFRAYMFTPPGISEVQMFKEVSSKIALVPSGVCFSEG